MSSQFRKSIKFKLIHHLRLFIQKNRIGYCGKQVYLDKNVALMRFPKNISIQDFVAIKEGAKICACNQKATVAVGTNTTIGYHTFIFASEKIEIGSDCMIAPFVYIVDSNHQTRLGMNMNAQPNETAAIKIGNDVWIASNVTILKGVEIANGAVIAANSVVNTNVGEYEIFGGTPAKKIGERK